MAVSESSLDVVTDQLWSFETSELLTLQQSINALLAQRHARAGSAETNVPRIAAALLAMGAVAEAAALPGGFAPSSTQFREHGGTVAPGWTVSAIVRLFGSW